MSDRATITISKRALELAEKHAAEEGISAEEYVDDLISGDSLDELLNQPWLQEKIDEGLKSGDAGLLTRERLKQLVDEGIASAEKDGK